MHRNTLPATVTVLRRFNLIVSITVATRKIMLGTRPTRVKRSGGSQTEGRRRKVFDDALQNNQNVQLKRVAQWLGPETGSVVGRAFAGWDRDHLAQRSSHNICSDFVTLIY